MVSLEAIPPIYHPSKINTKLLYIRTRNARAIIGRFNLLPVLVAIGVITSRLLGSSRYFIFKNENMDFIYGSEIKKKNN